MREGRKTEGWIVGTSIDGCPDTPLRVSGSGGVVGRSASIAAGAVMIRADAATLLANVVRWATDAAQAADEQREEAALRIQHCWETGAATLDLRNLRLSSLPGGLWWLDQVAADAVAEGSACSLPAGQRARPTLRHLLLDGNRLRVLPEGIAALSSLRHLSLAHNQLTTLPDALKRLPALTTLNVAANDLERLPDVLGAMRNLEVLRADGCLLRWIPPSVGTLPLLRELDLSDNALTSLPNALRWLPAECIVRLQDNPLAARVRQALDEGPAVPVWRLDAAGPRPPSRTLDEAAFAWMIAGADRCRASLDTWHALAAAQPDAARVLMQLLDDLAVLPEALNGDTRRAFRAAVRDVLKRIEADGSHASAGALASVLTGVQDCVAHVPPARRADAPDRRAALTRARWTAVCVRYAAAYVGGTAAEDRDDGAATWLDITQEQTLRRWVDRYVVGHPFLDCADVLHACRLVAGHVAQHGMLPLLTRAGAALQPLSPASPPPVVPAMQVMSEADFADCLKALRTAPPRGAPASTATAGATLSGAAGPRPCAVADSGRPATDTVR